MKCRHCGIEYSPKVCKIHEERCTAVNKETIKEANSITLETSTKTDLMVFIMSESNKKEADLKRLLKADLYDIASEIEKGL